MSKTPIVTLGVCLAAGLAFGIALARPGDQVASADVSTAPEAAVIAPADGTAGYGEAQAGDPEASAPQATAPAGAANGTVTIQGFDFGEPITVAPGAAITVNNADGAAHTLTASNGEFNTGSIGGNGSGSFIAPGAPGSYAFFCAFHPDMTGTLSVTG